MTGVDRIFTLAAERVTRAVVADFGIARVLGMGRDRMARNLSAAPSLRPQKVTSRPVLQGARMTGEISRRILVVDDDAATRRSLDLLLSKAGYTVMQAGDGAGAVRLWRDHGGDLVILDLFMPEKDGLETIIELRAHDPTVRILAMSSGGRNARLDVLADAKLLGAVLTIEKPFTASQMLAMVDRALHR